MIKRDLYYERIPTKSLREDVRYLGDILGRVIKKQEGQSFFKLVEDTRLLSKANLANKHVKDPFKNILNKTKIWVSTMQGARFCLNLFSYKCDCVLAKRCCGMFECR